jgi:hypothetical protein
MFANIIGLVYLGTDESTNRSIKEGFSPVHQEMSRRRERHCDKPTPLADSIETK